MTATFEFDADRLSSVKPMKACRVNRFGPPEVIALENVKRPTPGAGEVLVQVGAAGVGPWDAWIRAGKSVLPQPLPLTLGSDLSGTVVEVGVGVTEFAPGNAVFGVTNSRFIGAQAEYAVASASMVARRPDRIDEFEAAAVPVIVITAWQALFDHARLTQGQSVLIHGAAGGVGAYAVQLARWAGLRVVATASARDLAYVRSLGADETIDYNSTPFEALAGKVDAVIDLVGGETQTRSFAVLERGGALISAVSKPDQALAASHGVRAEFFLVDVTSERLAFVASLLDRGALKVEVGAILPLASVRLAHQMLEGARPRPRGKIVLRVAA